MNVIKGLLGESWKTAAAGYVGGVAIVICELCDLLGISVEQLHTDGKFDWKVFLVGLGMLGLGWAARDDDKTSEQVGAKKE
jgi:hypothetical protein